METQLTSDVPILRYSLLGVLAMVMAGASHLFYGFMFQILDNLLPDTATEVFLRRLARTWNVPEKSESQARGTLSVTSLNAATLYKGEQFQTAGGVVFETIIDYVFTDATSLDVNIQAVIAGTSGNVSDATMDFVNPPSDFLSTADVTSAPTGGDVEESVEALRERVLTYWAHKPASGDKTDIKLQCLSVEGVAYAWVLPAEEWKGAGFVGCLVAGPEMSPVSGAVLSAVQAVVDEKEVVGATSEVEQLTTSLLSTIIYVSPYTTANVEQIKENITQGLIDTARPGQDMRIGIIRDAVSAVTGKTGDYQINRWSYDGSNIQYYPNANIVNEDITRIFLAGDIEIQRFPTV
jgi:uncharacterized phage protein gp47/JayE